MQNEELIIRDNKIFGVSEENMFFKIRNSFMRDKESRFYFKPNSEGQLDYAIYITLLNNINPHQQFYMPINRLVESIGFKPRTGANNINNKVKQSIGRLEERGLIECFSKPTDKNVFGEIIILATEEQFFKLHIKSVAKILNYLTSRLSDRDYSSKYTDRIKALYLYSYLLSMMGTKITTEVTVEWQGCFPSLDTISKETNISKDYIMKLLAYFEYDGLIYTTNLGQLRDRNGSVSNAGNYYTNSLKYLSSSYIYSKAYCDKQLYTYSKYARQTKILLEEIHSQLELCYDRLNEKEFKCFKEHYVLMFNSTLEEVKDYFISISVRDMDRYIENKMYQNSKFKNKSYKIPLLFLADNEMASIPLLTHMKNKVKALMYLYGVL